MASELQPDERETRISMSGDDHDTWYVYTDDPYWIRRLDKLAEFVRDYGYGREYKLRADQLLIRAGKRQVEMTDERRALLAARMRRIQARNMEKRMEPGV